MTGMILGVLVAVGDGGIITTDVNVGVGVFSIGKVGTSVGISVGTSVGISVGTSVGISVGTSVGVDVGISVGLFCNVFPDIN